MRKPLIILLTLLSLLSQWAWVEHAYHEHDAGEVCKICLLGHAQSHAVLPTTLTLPTPYPEHFDQPRSTPQAVTRTFTRQNIRAPPVFSNPSC
jgi:hypothetical protein